MCAVQNLFYVDWTNFWILDIWNNSRMPQVVQPWVVISWCGCGCPPWPSLSSLSSLWLWLSSSCWLCTLTSSCPSPPSKRARATRGQLLLHTQCTWATRCQLELYWPLYRGLCSGHSLSGGAPYVGVGGHLVSWRCGGQEEAWTLGKLAGQWGLHPVSPA